MEVSGRRHQSSDDVSTGVLCDPCRGVNEDENAVFYCTVCNEYLCDADAKAHGKAALSKAHKLLDRDNMPRQKLAFFTATICSSHSGKLVEYFCKAHDEFVCSVCVTINHKLCNVEYIDDIAKDYTESTEFNSLEKALTDLTERLQRTKETSIRNKTLARHIHAEFVSEVRKFRLDINGVLDALENESLKEAQSILDLDIKNTDSVTTRCDKLVSDMQEMSSTIEKLKTYKQDRQLVIYSKKAHTSVNENEKQITELSNQNEMRDYRFHPKEDIRQIMNSLNSLGDLQSVENQMGPAEQGNKDGIAKARPETILPTPFPTGTATYVDKIDVSYSPGLYERFFGSKYVRCLVKEGIMIDDSKIACVDFNNSNVKIVDVNKKAVISCLKLEEQPAYIAYIDQDTIVVSCISGRILFLKVNSSLSIIDELFIGGQPKGILHTNNTLLVVFGHPDSCVKVIDLQEKILKTFKTDQAGRNLFSDPEYISLSTDQKTLYVSDSDNHSVTSLDMDGKVQHVFTDANLKCPRGLTVDNNDNVYVAGWASDNIIQ